MVWVLAPRTRTRDTYLAFGIGRNLYPCEERRSSKNSMMTYYIQCLISDALVQACTSEVLGNQTKDLTEIARLTYLLHLMRASLFGSWQYFIQVVCTYIWQSFTVFKQKNIRQVTKNYNFYLIFWYVHVHCFDYVSELWPFCKHTWPLYHYIVYI